MKQNKSIQLELSKVCSKNGTILSVKDGTLLVGERSLVNANSTIVFKVIEQIRPNGETTWLIVDTLETIELVPSDPNKT